MDETDLQVRCDESGTGATVSLTAWLRRATEMPRRAWLEIDGRRVPLELSESANGMRLTGSLEFEHVERWWPHTHGSQRLYPVVVDLDGDRRWIRRVGFRTVNVDREAGAFQVTINGTPCFCRGVVWGPNDVVSLTTSQEQTRSALALARGAGINMVRIGGFGVYEDERFWDACDELGIMVWQDCMLASVDPPDDARFVACLSTELRQQFGRLQGRPSLTVACGSSETYQQGSMYGLPRERYVSNVLEHIVPDVLAPLVPGVPYVPSSPSGGHPPFRPDTGVAHYFGVGAYLRPISDARLAGVRFAAECLSFATPPERVSLEETYGEAAVVGHDPRWKQAVARDAHTSWDFEDVRDHYVRDLFGVDPMAARYEDPEHALDLGRAVIVEIMCRVLGEWRRTGSGCAGALVLSWRDLWPGAGWGILDSLGRPKASYYALARAFAPRAVQIRDVGLSGLVIDVFNDCLGSLEASLRITVYNAKGAVLEVAERALVLDEHEQVSFDTAELLDGFRDLNGAYRFAPTAYELVRAELIEPGGAVLGRAYHLPGGLARRREPDLGLRAEATRRDGGRWAVELGTEHSAQFVSFDVPGFTAADSWFHLAPGESVQIEMTGDATSTPRGMVRALNSVAGARIDGGERERRGGPLGR